MKFCVAISHIQENVKLVPVQAIELRRGSGGIVPRIPNLGARYRWVTNLPLRLLYPLGARGMDILEKKKFISSDGNRSRKKKVHLLVILESNRRKTWCTKYDLFMLAHAICRTIAAMRKHKVARFVRQILCSPCPF